MFGVVVDPTLRRGTGIHGKSLSCRWRVSRFGSADQGTMSCVQSVQPHADMSRLVRLLNASLVAVVEMTAGTDVVPTLDVPFPSGFDAAHKSLRFGKISPSNNSVWTDVMPQL